MRNFHLYLSALLIAGCATDYVNPYLDGRYSHSAGNTTPTASQSAYQQGQADGCKSGEAAAGSIGMKITKNQDRYVSDPNYKSGWDEQFVVCKSQNDRMNRNIDEAIQRSFW